MEKKEREITYSTINFKSHRCNFSFSKNDQIRLRSNVSRDSPRVRSSFEGSPVNMRAGVVREKEAACSVRRCAPMSRTCGTSGDSVSTVGAADMRRTISCDSEPFTSAYPIEPILRSYVVHAS